MGDFLHALWFVEGDDVRCRSVVALLFIYFIVVVPKCGNLGEVCDADDLRVCADLLHHLSHTLCHGAAHSGVDFVEDDSRHFLLLCDDGFQYEHHACDFSSRCCLCNVLRRYGLVGREQEAYRICSCSVRCLAPGEFEPELSVGHAQMLQAVLEFLFDDCRSLFAFFRQCSCRSCQAFPCVPCRFLLPCNKGVGIFDEVELLAHARLFGYQFGVGLHMMLLEHAVDVRQSFFHEAERIVHKNIDVNTLVFDEEDDFVVPVDDDELDDDEEYEEYWDDEDE